jgi:hypothetical protein
LGQLNPEKPDEGYLSSFERHDKKHFGTAIDLPEEIGRLVFLVAGRKEILTPIGRAAVLGEVWIYSFSMDQDIVQIGPFLYRKTSHSLRK